MTFLCANRIAPDGTPRSAASHLGLYCLSIFHRRDARLIRVNQEVSGAFTVCFLFCKFKLRKINFSLFVF